MCVWGGAKPHVKKIGETNILNGGGGAKPVAKGGAKLDVK